MEMLNFINSPDGSARPYRVVHSGGEILRSAETSKVLKTFEVLPGAQIAANSGTKIVLETKIMCFK
jgi:hypothetical protein